jgi:hypothetical protein
MKVVDGGRARERRLTFIESQPGINTKVRPAQPNDTRNSGLKIIAQVGRIRSRRSIARDVVERYAVCGSLRRPQALRRRALTELRRRRGQTYV